jgi:hypothetical protein
MMKSQAQPASPASLPELQEALLDSPVLEQLFSDIETCTGIIEVIPKMAARACAPQTAISLAQGRQLLLSGRLRALQIRYSYAGSQWWDTLMCHDGRVRLVRIQHNFAEAGARE